MSQSPFPFPTAEHHEPAAPVPQPEPVAPDEATIDHGVSESFPASDPVSVSVTKVEKPSTTEAPKPPDGEPADTGDSAEDKP